jgi:predicted nuclease with RNAse H fold
MMNNSPAYIGIDPTAGRHPFTYAAFDQDFHLMMLAAGELEELLDFLRSCPQALVAVNAPPRPSQGLVRKQLEKQHLASGQLRGTDLRVVEYELRERGISISPTPSRAETCAGWTQMGFDLYRQLGMLGFRPYPCDDNLQWLETNPHAAYCALLGHLPLPKPTLEGRLQRQLALHGQGAGIKDPMNFFEEITRHKLLHGSLPTELIYTAEELDALAAAVTAWVVANRPGEFSILGIKQEGQVVLPSGELLERYS